jgi:hypothetical protein
MPVHGTFVGQLNQKPKKNDKPTGTFLGVDLRAGLNGPDVAGVNEAYVILDAVHPDTKEMAEQARFWNEGDLVQIEGQVIGVEKCTCCGAPIFVIGAFQCSRLLS